MQRPSTSCLPTGEAAECLMRLEWAGGQSVVVQRVERQVVHGDLREIGGSNAETTLVVGAGASRRRTVRRLS